MQPFGFVDPVSTGYSRPVKGVQASDFHGYNEDLASVGDFIRLYVTHKLNAGAARSLSRVKAMGQPGPPAYRGYLLNRYGMNLNGITLISSVLNFQLIDFSHGNEMPYAFFLPTYATTARYHHKLSPELESLSPGELTRKTEIFAGGAYASYLMEGDNASADETNRIVDSLHYFTGLSTTYIRQSRERINAFRFFKEVLRDEGKTVGRYDSRFTGEDIDDAERSTFDASDNNLTGLFVATFNNYVRKDLGFKNDQPYESTANVRPWTTSRPRTSTSTFPRPLGPP